MSTSPSLSDILVRELRDIADLSAAQLQLLEQHYQLLLKWNQRMNLTTVTNLPEAAVRHYCESLFLGAHLTPGRVADVGSGAGFPGIPAAILRPDCEFLVIESNSRKAVFLKEAARALSNVKVIAERAETFFADTPRLDWVVSRAVGRGEVLSLGGNCRYGLLVGRDDAEQLKNEGGRDVQILPLPWGDNRVLAIVPRGTTS
jgi:16S rRNA (guanine527-N7)-methyltransferase